MQNPRVDKGDGLVLWPLNWFTYERYTGRLVICYLQELVNPGRAIPSKMSKHQKYNIIRHD